MRKLSNLFLTLAVTSVAALFAETRAPGDFTSRITWQTLRQFAFSNAEDVKQPVRGIVVFHHGLGCAAFDADLQGWEEDYARHGLVAIHPHSSPWGWMNGASIKLADALVDCVIAQLKRPKRRDGHVVHRRNGMGWRVDVVWQTWIDHARPLFC